MAKKEIVIRFVDNSKYREKDVLEELSEYAELLYDKMGLTVVWDYVKPEKPQPPIFQAVGRSRVSDKTGKPYKVHDFHKVWFRIRYTFPAFLAGARMVYVFWDKEQWFSQYDDKEQDIAGQSIDDWMGVSECGFYADINKRRKIGKNKRTSALVRLALHEGIPGHSFWDHVAAHLRPRHISTKNWDTTHKFDYHHPNKLMELLDEANVWMPALYPEQTLAKLYEQLRKLQEKLANRMVYPIEKNLFIDRVTQGFAVRNSRYSSGIHPGLDHGVPVGTPVKAPWHGTIYQTFRNHKSMGNACYFKFARGDDVYYARFLHLKEVPRKGEYRKGDQIALTGNTGQSTGPHLHIDLWKNQPVDYNILRSKKRILEHLIDPYAFFRYEVDQVVV